MKRFVLTLDLKNDASLIAEYERQHEQVWPEIIASIQEAGILHMEIYRHDVHLFMIMETTDEFSFQKKALLDASNPKVQEWENMMWNYQQRWQHSDEKWIMTKKIFSL